MAETFSFATVAGVLITLATQLLKKKYPETNPRYFSVGLSFGFGLLYALGITFIPTEFLAKMSAFGSAVFVMATGLYKVQK